MNNVLTNLISVKIKALLNNIQAKPFPPLIVDLGDLIWPFNVVI